MRWVEETEERAPQYAGVLRSGLSWIALGIGDADDPPPAFTNDFVASSAVIDRYGDVIDQQTWQLANYRRNPVALYEHGRGDGVVIGRAVKVGITAKDDGTKELRARIQWDKGEHNPIGTLVALQHATGFRNAVSVGFRPHDTKSRTELDPTDPLYVNPNEVPRWRAGYVYRHNELYEISSVSVPGNQEALQLAAEIQGSESSEARLKAAIGEWLPNTVRDALLSAIQRDGEIRRALQVVMLGAERAPSEHSNALGWVG